VLQRRAQVVQAERSPVGDEHVQLLVRVAQDGRRQAGEGGRIRGAKRALDGREMTKNVTRPGMSSQQLHKLPAHAMTPLRRHVGQALFHGLLMGSCDGGGRGLENHLPLLADLRHAKSPDQQAS